MKKINMDYLRLIASFMVVAIHTYPLLFISDSLDYVFTRILFRVAVPFFLMITGYFILAKKDKQVLLKYTKKISFLYLLCIILYLPINIYNGYFHNFNILIFLKDIFLTGTLYHLWYFPATIIGLWVSYFIITKLSLKKSLIVVSILYIIGLFGDNYYNLISNISILKLFYDGIFWLFDYTRNFFLAPIFLVLGYSIKERKVEISHKKVLAILFIITLLIEGIISLKFNLSHHTSMYISLVPLMYILFSIVIENKSTNKSIRRISTIIYIIHPLFIVITHFASRYLSLLSNSLINFLVVAFLSFAFSYLIDILINKIKVYNKGKIVSN